MNFENNPLSKTIDTLRNLPKWLKLSFIVLCGVLCVLCVLFFWWIPSPIEVTYSIGMREASLQAADIQSIVIRDTMGELTAQLPSKRKLSRLSPITESKLEPINEASTIVRLRLQNSDDCRTIKITRSNSIVEVRVTGHVPISFALVKILGGKSALVLKSDSGKNVPIWTYDFDLLSDMGDVVFRGTLFLTTKTPERELGDSVSSTSSSRSEVDFKAVEGVFDPTKLASVPSQTILDLKEHKPKMNSTANKPQGAFAEKLFKFEADSSHPGIERGFSENLSQASGLSSGYSLADDDQVYVITSGLMETKNVLSEIITHSSTVFPGCIINGRLLTSESSSGPRVEKVSFGPSSRVSLTYGTDIGVSIGNIGIDPDDENAFNTQVLSNVRRSSTPVPTNVELTFGSFNSESHLKTKLGIAADGWGQIGEFSSEKAAGQNESLVFVLMRQRMFDIFATNPPNGIGDWFKAEKGFDEQSDMLKFSKACPLLYVDQVYYGKIAMLIVKGKGSSSDVTTAVKAAFSGWGVTVKTEFTESERKASNSLQGSLLVHGGDPGIASQIQAALGGTSAGDNAARNGIQMDKLMGPILQYFAPSAGAASAQPIGFTAKYMFDGSNAVCIAATHSRMCMVSPASMNYSICMRSLRLEEDGDGAFFGLFDGTGDWHVGVSQRGKNKWQQTGLMRLNDGKTHSLERFQWPFSSVAAKDTITMAAGDSDHGDDNSPIDASNFQTRWDAEVSFGAFDVPMDFREILSQGDPVDINGKTVAAETANYRQKNFSRDGPEDNRLDFAIRVQVPERMRKESFNKAMEELTKKPEMEKGTHYSRQRKTP